MKTAWLTKTLAEVCQIRPPKSEARIRLSDEDMVSFVPMEDLGIGCKFLTPKQVKPLASVIGGYTYFAEGDVLLAKITPCFENGKLGIAAALRNGIGFGSSEYVVFRPNSCLDSNWLYYSLSRQSFLKQGVQRMSGAVGHKRVPNEFIEACPIPVPPLPEQKRVVAILDEAFNGIGTAVANAEKNLATARVLFDSYLKALFFRRGERWVERRLGDLCENLDSRRIPITKSGRLEGETPYYGASGIVDYVSGHLFDEDVLLISEDGANLLARTYPIAFSVSGKSWVNNHAHVVRFSRFETQKLVEFYLNSISLAAYVSGMAQPKLNQKSLNAIIVPVPPIAEQAGIVGAIERLQAGVERVQKVYSQKLARLAELKKSILQKAFTGGLATQLERSLQEAAE